MALEILQTTPTPMAPTRAEGRREQLPSRQKVSSQSALPPPSESFHSDSRQEMSEKQVWTGLKPASVRASPSFLPLVIKPFAVVSYFSPAAARAGFFVLPFDFDLTSQKVQNLIVGWIGAGYVLFLLAGIYLSAVEPCTCGTRRASDVTGRDSSHWAAAFES